MWGELVHNKDKKRYFDSVDDILRGMTDIHNVEYQVKNRNNEYAWVVCRGLLKRDQNYNPLSFAGVVTPIGSKGKIDRTTGLFTHEMCRERVEVLLNQGSARGGLLLLGLDDFKQINNLKDHTFGELVLRQMAQNIQQMLPSKAEIFRFDGDEFAVVCPEASLEEIEELYRSIYTYANCEHEIDGISYFCSVSGGYPSSGEKIPVLRFHRFFYSQN